MNGPAPAASGAFISSLESCFALPLNEITSIMRSFHEEMGRGLSGQSSSLKMLPSFVDIPRGTEKGTFLALDLGGTNVRVLAVELDGRRNATVPTISTFVVPHQNRVGTGVALFDFIACCVDSFLTEHRLDRTRVYDLAFTFSFPVAQTTIASGTLIAWTKGFTARGVQGKDVVELLNAAFKRTRINCINVTALTNDTVGTLAAGSYRDPACDMGVILGTGTNGCYREKSSNIKILNGHVSDEYMIVNMEWGNFDTMKRTRYDRQLDEASVNQGAMFLEKMVSGMYLGEVTRLVLMDMIERNLIFLNVPDAAERFGGKDSLTAEHMSLIQGDETAQLHDTDAYLKMRGVKNSTLPDRLLLTRLCEIVSARAAAIGTTAVSAVLTWMDPALEERHTVAVDGSLFEKYPGFETSMRETLTMLHGKNADNIRLVHCKDGSGRGAAIVAAVAASKQ